MFFVGLITSPSKLAPTLAQKLLQQKLVACVNIVPTVQSMYWWEDKIVTDEESLLIIKTVAENKEEIIKSIKQWHEYSVPETIFLPIESGNEDYLKWVLDNTKALKP